MTELSCQVVRPFLKNVALFTPLLLSSLILAAEYIPKLVWSASAWLKDGGKEQEGGNINFRD